MSSAATYATSTPDTVFVEPSSNRRWAQLIRGLPGGVRYVVVGPYSRGREAIKRANKLREITGLALKVETGYLATGEQRFCPGVGKYVRLTIL